MIVQIIGWFCLIMALLEFIDIFVQYNKNNLEGGRWAGLSCYLCLICAAICFK